MNIYLNLCVLDSLRQHGLTAKPSKTEVAFDKLIFLRHKVGGGYLEPDQSNQSKIPNIRTTTTKRQARHSGFGKLQPPVYQRLSRANETSY